VLHLLGEQFREQDTVLAAYNAGMGRVQTWLADTAYSTDGETLHTIPFKETRHYVTKVRLAQKIYQKLYGLP
jgi:soluble lytic murein transglycosylase